MGKIIISDGVFQHKILDKMPIPEEGQCYLLYRKDMKKDKSEWMDNSLVLESGMRCSSAVVRHEGYNQKVVLSYETNTIKITYNLFMKEREYKSKVEVELSYQLSDARKYYFLEKVEPEDISYNLKRAISRYDGYWNIYHTIEMQREMEREVEDSLRNYKGLSFRILNINVIPDEAVRHMHEIKKSTDIDMYDAENNANKKMNQNDWATKTLYSDFQVEQLKKQIIGESFNKFGTLAPIIDAYTKQEITGEQLHQYIIAEREREMNMTKNAYKDDLISHETVDINMKKVFGNGVYQQINDNSTQDKTDAQSKDEYMADDPVVGNGDIL